MVKQQGGESVASTLQVSGNKVSWSSRARGSDMASWNNKVRWSSRARWSSKARQSNKAKGNNRVGREAAGCSTKWIGRGEAPGCEMRKQGMLLRQSIKAQGKTTRCSKTARNDKAPRYKMKHQSKMKQQGRKQSTRAWQTSKPEVHIAIP
jgi:hypothetical protein